MKYTREQIVAALRKAAELKRITEGLERKTAGKYPVEEFGVGKQEVGKQEVGKQEVGKKVDVYGDFSKEFGSKVGYEPKRFGNMFATLEKLVEKGEFSEEELGNISRAYLSRMKELDRPRRTHLPESYQQGLRLAYDNEIRRYNKEPLLPVDPKETYMLRDSYRADNSLWDSSDLHNRVAYDAYNKGEIDIKGLKFLQESDLYNKLLFKRGEEAGKLGAGPFSEEEKKVMRETLQLYEDHFKHLPVQEHKQNSANLSAIAVFHKNAGKYPVMVHPDEDGYIDEDARFDAMHKSYLPEDGLPADFFMDNVRDHDNTDAAITHYMDNSPVSREYESIRRR